VAEGIAMEFQLEIYVLFAGLLLVLFGHLWLMWRGFREGFFFGILAILPLLNFLLLLFMYRRAVRPALTILLGVGIAAAPMIANRLIPIDLGPRERIVDGELHITLSGWDRSEEGTWDLGRKIARKLNRTINGWDRRDYSVLSQLKDVVVLQMNKNLDVTDETLIVLLGQDKLKELDLSETSITDDGLKWVARLPSLKWLRVSRTGITDKGIREHLMDKRSLERLEVFETSVTSETRREWRQAQPGRATMPR
jgi:hypothetical protein